MLYRLLREMLRDSCLRWMLVVVFIGLVMMFAEVWLRVILGVGRGILGVMTGFLVVRSSNNIQEAIRRSSRQ